MGSSATRSICAAACLLLFASCTDRGGEPVFPPRKVREPDPEAGAIVTGTCFFEGRPPLRRPIEMASESGCGLHTLDAPPLDESIVVTDGRLRDVLVLVSHGLEKWTFAYDRSEVVLDQARCTFVPHVLCVRRHQPVVFKNSDTTTHNVNTRSSATSQGFNRSILSGGKGIRWQFIKSELGFQARCNIHPWMLAWIHVVDHPYFFVTGEDGSYALPRKLPPGSYRLSALHPKLGRQDVDVTIPDSGRVPRDFTFRK